MTNSTDAVQIDRVRQGLSQAARELIDRSRRNPLLHHRPSRNRGVATAGESATFVIDQLVAGRQFRFLPAPEDRRQPSDQPEFVPLVTDPTDHALQTRHLADELQDRLTNTRRQANTLLQETGVNNLCLAFGTLTWYENEKSEQQFHSPLLLLPVQLERSDARSNIRLRASGEDPAANIALLERLKETGIDLYGPEAELLPDEPAQYLAGLTRRIEQSENHDPRWQTDPNTIHLDIFSYAKQLMYRELADGTDLEEHPLIQALFGAGQFNNSPVPDSGNGGGGGDLDQLLTPTATPHVLNADSSQAIALHRAGLGDSMVLQGPPGTGKSQTIVNLLAQQLTEGKRILFVAEKLAALEVVKRRLDHLGLGPSVLELHSHKTNKRTVLQELQRTLEDTSPTPEPTDHRPELAEIQVELNALAQELNQPIGESGLTPHQVHTALLQRDGRPNQLPRPDAADWDDTVWQRNLSDYRLLCQRYAGLAEPLRQPEHPWSGTAHRLPLLPSDIQRIAQAAERYQRCVRQAVQLVRTIHPNGSEEPEPDLEELRQDLAAAQPYDPRLLNTHWPAAAGTILEVAQLRQQQEDLTQGQPNLAAAARQCDPDRMAVIASELQSAGLLSKLFSRQIKEHRKYIAILGPPKGTQPERYAAQIAAYQELEKRVDPVADRNAQLLTGPQPDQETSWAELAQLSARRQELSPNAIRLMAQHGNNLPALDAELAQVSQETAAAGLALQQLMLIPLLPAGDNWIPALTGSLSHVNDYLAFLKIQDEISSELLPLAQELPRQTGWTDRPDDLENHYHEQLLRNAYTQHGRLAGFQRQDQERLVQRFQELDELVLLENRDRAWAITRRRAANHRGLPDRLLRTVSVEHPEYQEKEETRNRQEQLRTLQREVQKRSRHKPVRQLLHEAGPLIQELKPIFMMSPLSVATMLPKERVQFDLVIFDEASQVTPAEGLAALARGQQAVIVGDPRQLPPSSFFHRAVVADSEADEEQLSDLSSLLELMLAAGAPVERLRWHYRSQHHSLIQVSNQEFYENGLVVCPSPSQQSQEFGLHLHHLPDSAYDRGGSRVNAIEADAVSRAVTEHAAANPDRTLGVAAFNENQARAIEDRVDRLRRENPEIEPFFQSHPEEPFFVKNLENVQGDERDVMFISVGYGRDGAGHLTQNFGPLNQAGGERRLNVLITRAKRSCRVWSNLTYREIDPNGGAGVQAFHTFLKYAETGTLERPAGSSATFEVDSPFQQEVTRRLRDLGYLAESEVAVGGRFIDIGIRDPNRLGTYLIGIECDGATYHSSRSARDRDRIRETQLYNMGWRLHRIWSSDWFREPARELRRCAAAIEEAQGRTKADD